MNRAIGICRCIAIPAAVAVIVVLGLVYLHYAAASEPDLGPFKSIEVTRGTAI